MYVAILVGNVLTVIESMNRESEKHRERMGGITGLMTQYKLPKVLRRQLRKWVVRASRGVTLASGGDLWADWCPGSCLTPQVRNAVVAVRFLARRTQLAAPRTRLTSSHSYLRT